MNQSGGSFRTTEDAVSAHLPECVVDLQSQIIACTSGFAALLGFDASDRLVGRTLLDFVHPSSVAVLDPGSAFQAVYDGAGSGDVRLVREDGQELNLHTTVDVVEIDGSPARRLTFAEARDRI